ncbi:MAG TPA: hypothetical protein PKD00_05435 [Burkholderiales bacterium]|nr:hypothetical protein [Burkholderiales bacterium]
MKKFSANLGLFILRVFNWLPVKVTRFIGSLLGTLGYYVVRERRNVGLVNLTLCFPNMSIKEKKKIIKEHFKYLVCAVLEYGFVFFASRKDILKYIKLKNLHYITDFYQKKPIILLCPHFVGLDLGAVRLTQEVVGFSMYSRQRNNYINEKLKDARLRFIKDKGGEVFAQQEGFRPIIKKMRQTKGLFYYLPDQDLGAQHSVYVPFFAHQTTATVSALPKIVEMTDAVVVPSYVYFKDDHYVMEFFPAWKNYPSGNVQEDIKKMNIFIEESIKKAMPQYFWLHKRFKSQPDGRHKLYKDC